MTQVTYTTPGLDEKASVQTVERLQQRLNSLIDLTLTLKHIHWNVVGPSFIGVHEMLDTQVEALRAMVDETAERIATLGGTPVGTPGYVVEHRTWDDYTLHKALVPEHLAALDVVYTGVIGDHREACAELGELDPVSEDMIISQLSQLELFHWFVRAHLEDGSGKLATEGATKELEAAGRVT